MHVYIFVYTHIGVCMYICMCVIYICRYIAVHVYIYTGSMPISLRILGAQETAGTVLPAEAPQPKQEANDSDEERDWVRAEHRCCSDCQSGDLR